MHRSLRCTNRKSSLVLYVNYKTDCLTSECLQINMNAKRKSQELTVNPVDVLQVLSFCVIIQCRINLVQETRLFSVVSMLCNKLSIDNLSPVIVVF